jgi:hypothetical protein
MADGVVVPKKAKRSASDNLITFLDRISFGKVFIMWFVVIAIFATAFFALSVSPNHALSYRGTIISPNLPGFFNSIYYSFITITTTGYGDISPNGLSKLLAILEVVSGVILTGVLISKLVGIKQERILEEVYDISYEEIIDRLRSGLYLFRSDVNRTLEKIESGSIRPREVKDLWMVFSGLDTTLSNIKNMIMPVRGEKYYYKRIDVFRLELLLNSIQLSLNKMLELIKNLKAHDLDWRNELLISSIHLDVGIVREITDYEGKKNHDKKVNDKLEGLRKTIWEIECEEKEEQKDKPKEEK